MILQARVIIIWLSWLVGGVCGVAILLIIICYCRFMPRQQKSFDEQYLKEKHKDARNIQDCSKTKSSELHRHVRPVSYAGPLYYSHKATNMRESELPPSHSRAAAAGRDVAAHCYVNSAPGGKDSSAQYASSGMLDDMENGVSMDALKTRSLPAFLRPKPRPLSTEDDLQQLYAKVNYSKKYKNRMRNDHAAIIALSKSHSQFLDADAVIVYDQRTAL